MQEYCYTKRTFQNIFHFAESGLDSRLLSVGWCLSPVHTTTQKFENPAKLLWLGLLSILIRQENQAFRNNNNNL